jgi:fatty-acyl-CoA synthase
VSILTREILTAATSSSRGLTVGTVADPVRVSWSEIHDQAIRMAGCLAARGVGRHGTVAVLAAGAADVAPLAQALWSRRAALTMLQQPTPRSELVVWLDDTVRAIRMIHADLVVVGAPFEMAREQLLAYGLDVCTVESLRASLTTSGDTDEPDEADIAVRQLTSGSTGEPKAVEITHANLAAHSAAVAHTVQIDIDNEVLASWLPLSHDMGFIGFVQFPMQLGLDSVVITTDQFLRRPLIWAEMISRHRATMTSGPNFAYSLLARLLEAADPADIDLGSLRIAVNGAEPVNHRDLENFSTIGARFGLRPSALKPAYGLAEATLIVSMDAPQDTTVVDEVSQYAVMAEHRADPVPTETPGIPGGVQHVVGLGRPVRGMDVRIVRDGKVLGPRGIGTIELRGPTLAAGYLTSEGVVGLGNRDGWFDTGDLGYVDAHGRIYVCGRGKDLIVLAGANLYPNDIERAAETVEGVRKGCVIALRIDAEREGFAILAEVREADRQDVRLRVSRDIIARVNHHVGHAPREVRLFPAGTLPKTASGKLRRSDARELLS